MFFTDFPNQEDYQRIYKKSPFSKITWNENYFNKPIPEDADFKYIVTLFENNDISDWNVILFSRLHETLNSYVFAQYYYELGIPDEPHFISPGKDGSAYDLFPNLTSEILLNRKTQFDYFSDVFFYKIFSAFDTLAHLMFLRLPLEPVDKIDFRKAINMTNRLDRRFGRKLKKIMKSDKYKSASRFRNDATHNYPMTSVGPGLKVTNVERKDEQGHSKIIGKRYSFGIGKYTPAREVVLIMDGIVECMISSLSEIKKYIVHN